jgi:hypothetical protein
MPVAEVTTTDLRKTRYQVESKDDISKTREGYKIETAKEEAACLTEEEAHQRRGRVGTCSRRPFAGRVADRPNAPDCPPV